MNPLNDFMTNARGLTKNPLGIIGLFISLIYGFACLVLSTSISNLTEPEERIPLIWFIIIFPLIILGAFIFLVVNHHEKLYAPSDFRDDNAFIETMSGGKIKEKQEKEAELLNSAEEEPSIDDSQDAPTATKANTVGSKQNENASALVGKTEIAQRLANSEKWAIKELELRYNIQFRTNQRLISNNMKLELDAYGQNSSMVVIAEVKYWHSHRSVKPLLLSIQEFVLKIDRFKRAFGNKKVELAIVIVFDELVRGNVDKINAFIATLNQKVRIEYKQYSQLEKDYKE